MSILLVTYLLNSLLLCLLGIVFLKKYYNLWWVFFLTFCISTASWFIFFFLSYFSTTDLGLLLLFWKIAYYLSIITLYSFIAFLYYFRRQAWNIHSLALVTFWVFSMILGYLYIYTPLVIDSLYFDTLLQDWYENPWPLYSIHIILTSLFIPLSLWFWIYRFKNVSSIDKKRLQYIFIGMFSFILLCIIFLLILPFFWFKGHMDRYISFFFLPFIIGVFYAIRRYDFLNFKITVMNVILYLYSFFFAYLALRIVHKFSLYLHEDFRQYWWIEESSLFLELVIWIFIFLGVFKLSRKSLNTFLTQSSFNTWLEELKKEIPFILNLKELNIFLKKSFSQYFHIGNTKIVSENKWIYKKLRKFFSQNKNIPFIINDVVFIEENKKILGTLYKEMKELSIWSYIIFPLINSNKKVQWIFEVWAKQMRDPFLTTEFYNLESFSHFLSSHLKYIDIYKQIQDLTVSLDKRVDEKTIEYNNLLNKQKEFIAYVWHEIKNPVTNTLFLGDSLKEATQDIWNPEIEEDINILYDELVKVSKLVKYIFSAEKFDLDKVQLYKEDTNLSVFLQDEIQSFRHKFPNINFIDEIAPDIERAIDQTQFRQVIQNLMNNSIKFTNKTDPKISLILEKKWKKITIIIQDNGVWFDNIDIKDVFWKYATGWSSASWLGMWLYLCKKIVELHGGNIKALKSKWLWGACFSIEL